MDVMSSRIRNIAVLGHQGCGKTTLVESLFALVSGTEKGSIEKKNTVSDFLKEEKARLSSTSTAVIPLMYKDTKINVLDIPGNDDFMFEAVSASYAIDGAVLVVDASSKVQIGTIKAYKLLKKRNIPTIIFVNKYDKPDINLDDLMASITQAFGKGAISVTYPVLGGSFNSVINALDMVKVTYNGKAAQESALSDGERAIAEQFNGELVEKVAGSDEALMEKFFGGEEFTKEEMHKGLKTAMQMGEIIPVMAGSALNNAGVATLLDLVASVVPAPTEAQYEINGVSVKVDESEAFLGYVMKTFVDAYLGAINVVKVITGTLKVGDDVLDESQDRPQKVSSMYSLNGKNQEAIEKAVAGDIIALAKLNDVNTGDILADKNKVVKVNKVEFPSAVFYKAISVKERKDEDKLSPALARIKKEDPTVEIKRNEETKQLLIGGLSDSALAFILEKLKTNFSLDLNVADQKVCYRETIKKKGSAIGSYKKQSGGSGFFGVVEISYEPAQETSFEEQIFGGAVPKNYFPAIEKGFYESLEKGLLAGFPVLNVKAILLDGKYHPVDSNEQAFRMASILAYKEAYMKCSPTILEPILEISISIESKYVGDVMSDLSSRRGRIQEMNEKEDGTSEINALIPEAETVSYCTVLKALTQGSGSFTRKFYAYEEVPFELRDRIIRENSLLTNESK